MTQFLDAKTVRLAKSVGFDGPELSYGHFEEVGYIGDDETTAEWISDGKGHTLEQVRRFLIEKHGLYVSSGMVKYHRGDGLIFIALVDKSDGEFRQSIYESDELFADPFTAELEGTRKALQYIKQMKEGK